MCELVLLVLLHFHTDPRGIDKKEKEILAGAERAVGRGSLYHMVDRYQCRDLDPFGHPPNHHSCFISQ